MDSLQQSIFQSLAKNTQYSSNSKKITQKHEMFPKYRRQEIQNEFELVDLHSKGKLTQGEIITYLSDKYQWVNTDVLKELFSTMHWDSQNAVTKEQFVSKYLARQRKLYNEINGLKYYQNWVDTLDSIYASQTNTYSNRPRVYFYTQVRSIQLYYESKFVQWMDLVVEYENHQSKTNYQIEQVMHQANYPSFEIWLPAKSDEFFLKFKFYDSNNRAIMYGQTYLSIPLNDKVNKMATIDLPITKNGRKVGHCVIYAYAQGSMQKVKEELNEIKSKQRSYSDAIDDKVKQYEYLQFLWGIRQKSPNKVQQVDVGWMLAFRMILLSLIGILGIVVHVLGRYEPLSIIIMFLMLRTWQFVLLRHQKFLLAWLTAASILLDIIWIALSSSQLNQINFMSQSVATIITYILLGVKVVLLGYLLIVQKSLSSR